MFLLFHLHCIHRVLASLSIFEWMKILITRTNVSYVYIHMLNLEVMKGYICI